MKIKGWEKISGFTYKGYAIVNPMHNADETKYFATILNLNLPQKPKWELVVLTPAHEFRAVNDDKFHIMLWDEDKFSARKQVSKDVMESITNFRAIVEQLIDEILGIQLTSAPTYNSHSLNVNSGTSGIVSVVSNSGVSIDYGKVASELINVLKNQNNISDELKKELIDLIK